MLNLKNLNKVACIKNVVDSLWGLMMYSILLPIGALPKNI
jgi:hypothetical protein